MKINKILSLAAVSALSLGFAACIDDESTYGNPEVLPSLSVTDVDPDATPVVNSYLGSETVITPKIDYDGSAPLSYEWSVLEDNVYEVVSTEPVFRHSFAQGGVYSVVLKVTDGAVGFSQEYEVNINRPFEKGYVLISNSAEGVGNLVFLKDMTAEEIDEGVEPLVFEDCISIVVPDARKEKLVNAHIVKPSWPPTAKGRLMVSTSSRCYFLDPNSFTMVANLSYPSGFTANGFLPAPTECQAFDSNSKRVITLKSDDVLAVEEGVWKNTSFDGYVVNTYEAYGSISSDKAYVTTNPTALSNRTYDYDTEEYVFSPTTELAGDEWIAAGPGQQVTEYIDYGEWGLYPVTSNSVYVLTRDKSNGDIWWSSYTGFDEYADGAPTLQQRKVVGNSSSAVPAVSSSFAVSYKFSRTYYYNGNHVYVMLEGTDGINNLPSTSQWALQFPSGEEVTYIGMDKTSVKNDEILIVATVNASTGRGNVYFYNPRDVRTDNPGANPTKTYLDCADRISNVFYKKRY